MSKNEYQGGFYVIIEYIGLYVRYAFCKIFQSKKTLTELSGEINFPQIDRKERVKNLLTGLFAIVIILFLLSILSILV